MSLDIAPEQISLSLSDIESIFSLKTIENSDGKWIFKPQYVKKDPLVEGRPDTMRFFSAENEVSLRPNFWYEVSIERVINTGTYNSRGSLIIKVIVRINNII